MTAARDRAMAALQGSTEGKAALDCVARDAGAFGFDAAARGGAGFCRDFRALRERRPITATRFGDGSAFIRTRRPQASRRKCSAATSDAQTGSGGRKGSPSARRTTSSSRRSLPPPTPEWTGQSGLRPCSTRFSPRAARAAPEAGKRVISPARSCAKNCRTSRRSCSASSSASSGFATAAAPSRLSDVPSRSSPSRGKSSRPSPRKRPRAARSTSPTRSFARSRS